MITVSFDIRNGKYKVEGMSPSTQELAVLAQSLARLRRNATFAKIFEGLSLNISGTQCLVKTSGAEITEKQDGYRRAFQALINASYSEGVLGLSH